MRHLVIPLSLFLPAFAGHATPQTPGETWQIVRVVDSEGSGSNHSTGTTHDADALVERVVAVRGDGVELEYDLPPDAEPGERASSWHFPARIFRPLHGLPELRNRVELEARVDPWLKSGGMTRANCGHWIFTWNAFRIDCDPQSVLAIVAKYDLGDEPLREGAPYRIDGALAPAPLKQTRSGPDGVSFAATMPIDPEEIRSARAEEDRTIAQLSGKSLSLEEATRAHATEKISGTVTVTFVTDAAGLARRRTTVTKIEVRSANEQLETRTITETLVRRRVGAPPGSV